MQSDDRKLLEDAAKAHGGVEFHRFMNYPVVHTGDERDGDPIVPWIPLDDDGDAMRLMVKLRIKLYGPGYAVTPEGRPCVEDGGNNSDLYADTRRAIVRAAAWLATPGSQT